MAAVEIFHSQAAEDQNIGVQLLADTCSVFQSITGDKITSAGLLEKLKEIETSPWADWGKGKGLTLNGLSRLLKPFGIGPRTIRVDEKTAKGYLRESFEDAFSRYLTLVPSSSELATVTPSQPACLLVETDFSTRNTKADVTDRKSASTPHEHCIVTDVTVANPPRAGVDGKEAIENLPSCQSCGSFALYREKDGQTICQTCSAKQESPAARLATLGSGNGQLQQAFVSCSANTAVMSQELGSVNK